MCSQVLDAHGLYQLIISIIAALEHHIPVGQIKGVLAHHFLDAAILRVVEPGHFYKQLHVGLVRARHPLDDIQVQR